jgi:hypothetical protein
MSSFTAVIDRYYDSELYVDLVSGFSAAHSQEITMNNRAFNLNEVLEMLPNAPMSQ